MVMRVRSNYSPAWGAIGKVYLNIAAIYPKNMKQTNK